MDDETLVAFVDGELGPDAAAQVAAAADGDPALAARIAMFRRTRAALAAHRVPGPVPDALAERIRATVAAAQPAVARRWASWPTALAASLALAVGLGAGLGTGLHLGGPGAPDGGFGVVAVSGADVAAALAELASGERRSLPDGGEVALVASFLGPDGTLCREFEVTDVAGDTLVSVACHGTSAWDVRFALAAPADTGGYAPASSIETLEVWLETTGMGEPLTGPDEADLLRRLPR